MAFLETLARTLSGAILATALAPQMVAALDAPTGKVVLTISGMMSETNNGDTAEFDIAMLEALPQETFETSTIWTEGSKVFRGPSLRTILDTVGAKTASLRVTALNDYAIELDATGVGFPGPILATTIDGEYMPVRNKGPIWVVYPYDLSAEYRTETIYSNSIWQLHKIEVLPEGQ